MVIKRKHKIKIIDIYVKNFMKQTFILYFVYLILIKRN